MSHPVARKVGPRAPDDPVDQLIVFLNPFSTHSLTLARAVADAARGRPAVGLAGFVDASPYQPPPWPLLAARKLGVGLAQRCIGPRGRTPLPANLLPSPLRLARRYGVPLLVPEARDVNHPSFCAALRSRFRRPVAVALECLQIFGAELLACFEMAANYHNGRLPEYRGLGATAWSVYNGDAESCFTFHRMDARIDTGAVLIEGAVAVAADATTGEVEAAKTRAAIAAVPELLDALERRAAGRPQRGQARYFGRQDRQRMRTIVDPSSLTSDELTRRLRAFGSLVLEANGRSWEVTALRPAERGGRPGFVAADGVPLELHRCRHLPPALYRVVGGLLPGRSA